MNERITPTEFSSPESLQPPQEHLLHVGMGDAILLLPDTPNYQQYDGLETRSLVTCTGIALFIPQDSDVALGIGHLEPFQKPSLLMEMFRKQLMEAGIDFCRFSKQWGFIELIPGQRTYDKGEWLSRYEIARARKYFKKQFPRLTEFPYNKVSYPERRGNRSFSVKLLKDCRLIISGNNMAGI